MKTLKLSITFFILFTFTSDCFSQKDNIFFWKINTNNEKVIFLSFDDGPGEYTKEILVILKKYDIKAIFFVLGELAKFRQDIIREIVRDGHIIGSHTYSHKNFYQLQKNNTIPQLKKILVDELEKTEAELKKILTHNFKIQFLRMPNGYYRQWMDEVIMHKFGYKVINWTFGCDWHNYTEDEMFKKYINALQPGGIYLFHDGGKHRDRTVKVLERFINYCLEKKYKFGHLNDWIK
ncbi:MAG: polysaccharide deacetylase family protein [Endomicrobia bacterium]|nr:polysaccharide deacetylase family protein [Endomicrobiia bacterium]MCX7940938.1 polysaccharide deacetylase family protein [Endomicrobiia bacterium]MDW8055661.1 polysaccharide deacetylase family protein [Elusimicrobiota bacterium]